MALTAISFAATACEDEHEYTQGPAEDPDCYGVYFPAQEVSNIILDPADEQAFTLTVSRNNTDGNIVVPVEVEDKDGVFTIPEIAFEDGQSSTEVKVTFNAEVGQKYSGSISITDNKYASIYNSESVIIEFSVTREKWNVLEGKGVWTESGDAYFNNFSEEVEIQQNDNNKNLFRVKMKDGDWAVYTDDNDEWFEFRILKPGETFADVKVTMSDLVAFSTFNTGYISSNYPGDPVHYLFPASFTSLRNESAWAYNRVLQYQDNGLPAGVAFAPYCYLFGAGGGWNFTTVDKAITLIFPGAKLVDYSLEMAAGFADEGEIPVNFIFGADVAKAKYAAYEGELNAVQLAAKAESIIDGSETAAAEITEGGVVKLSFDATGVYTVVAVSYDAEGNAQQSASTSFGYVAADDTVPVVVSCGMEATGKYEPKGYTSENSLEFYIYGKELADVKVGVFDHAKFASNQSGCIQAVLSGKSLDAESLAAINADGYVDIFTKLTPGTQYHMIVIASNGYEQKAIAASATTTGDPLPVYMNYSLNDYAPSFGATTENDLMGKSWNLYATDLFGKLGMREYIGKAEFTDSETPDEEITDDGDPYTDYYMYVGGFGGPYALDEEYGFDDKIEAVLEDGLIILPTAPATVADPDMLVYGLTADGSAYKVAYSLYGIPVADGYYAFVSNPGYTSQGVEMAGLGYYNGGFYAGYTDYLLVDPDKDENGLAPAQAAANLQRIKDAIKIAGSSVLTPESRDRSFREALKNLTPANLAGNKAGIKGSREGRSAAFTATPAKKVSKNDSLEKIQRCSE